MGCWKRAMIISVAIASIVNTCEAKELTASWYSVESLKKEGTWKKSKGRCADGSMFRDSNLTCATRLWPLGTKLQVRNKKNEKSVIVKVTDRIGKRFANTRIDLSESAFKKIAYPSEGLVKVEVKEVQ
jgi:rare lipoprotein A